MKRFIAIVIAFSCLNIEANSQTGWFPLSSETTSYWLNSVHFADNSTGWAAGRFGTIIKTTNGGINWTLQSSNTSNDLESIHFADNNTGWAVGDGGTIRKTTNGGTHWAIQISGTGNWLYSVHFTDNNTGWAVGGEGTIIKTTNGGTNWTVLSSGTGSWLFSVHFADNNTGWAVGTGSIIIKTTNGGTEWAQQASGVSWWVWLESVYFVDNTNGWTVGNWGSITRTTNGGSNWTPLTSGTDWNLSAVQFADINTGWVVGGEKILKTTNGGTNWAIQSSGTNFRFIELDFINSNVGWAIGEYCWTLKTITGGDPYPPSCGPGNHFVDICSAGIDSLDFNHICQTSALVRLSLDTSDNCNVPSITLPMFSGPTVIRRSDPKDTSGRFPGVAQLDGHNDIIETEMLEMDLRTFVESNGDTAFLNIVAGAGRGTGPCGSALKASYGYIHELPAYSYNAESFFDIFIEICIEDPHGIIGPPNPRYYLYNLAQVGMKATIDQIPPKCGRDPNTNEYYTVYRPDPNTCSKLYASCIPGTGNPPLAKIVHVEHALPVELTSFASATSGNDVALNWTTSKEINNSGFSIERSSGTNWNVIGFVAGKGNYSSVSSYEFTDKNLASGIYHYRLKQIDFNGNYEYFELPEAVTIGVPDKFFVDQNYPNPFNPTTTIGYGIPQSGNITLKIFDMTGKEIRTLVNEYKEAGYYVAKFDGSSLSSGTYIYRIESGNFVTAKKMVMLK